MAHRMVASVPQDRGAGFQLKKKIYIYIKEGWDGHGA